MKDNKPTKWRTIVGLFILGIAVVLDWSWVWGILFLFWVIPGFFTGKTYFIEEITKQDNPALYWIISISWLLFSLYYIVESIYAI